MTEDLTRTSSPSSEAVWLSQLSTFLSSGTLSFERRRASRDSGELGRELLNQAASLGTSVSPEH